METFELKLSISIIQKSQRIMFIQRKQKDSFILLIYAFIHEQLIYLNVIAEKTEKLSFIANNVLRLQFPMF